MNWLNDFQDQIEFDAPVGKQTWFRLGGRAKYLFQPHSVASLSAFVARARLEDVPLKVLGRGANVLVSDDGFDGVVVRLDQPAFRRIHERGESLEVGAGVDLMPLAKSCSSRGLSGLECMAGIPATVGGAVRMNAGGRFGDFGDCVEGITVLTLEGEIEEWAKERCGFTYRHSEIEEEIVLSARLRVERDDPEKVLRAYESHFAEKQRTQPIAAHSAGCIFKNPPNHAAGALIDRAGLKGARSGLAEVSHQHANFIVAQRGATASDVLRLIDVVRERIVRKFAIELELEVDVWHPLREGTYA
jgi:UDP-N-acetylmuramate dehydrogenase